MENPTTPGGTRISWSAEEDAILLKSVALHNGKNWKAVAAMLPNRTRAQCAHRYQKVLNPSLKKGAWSNEEDACLSAAVMLNGPGKWSRIAEHVQGRNGKQCRERWQNHLRKDVKKEPFSPEEDALIISLREQVGNRWAQIARHLPGRTENAVKNRWNAKLAFETKGGSVPSTPRQRSRSSSTDSLKSSKNSTISALSGASITPGTPKSITTTATTTLGGCSKKPSLSISTNFEQPSKLSVLTSISSVLSSPANRFTTTPRSSVAEDFQASLSRKRSSSLLSVLAGESPAAAKRQRSVDSLLELLTPSSLARKKAAIGTPLSKFNPSGATASTFSIGSFKKSNTTGASTPLATLTSVAAAAAAQPSSSEIDWLASIAAARALTSLSARAPK